MQVISLWFLIFFAVAAAVYYLLPPKVRYIWLFAASIFFYISQGTAHTVFLLLSMATTWAGGLLLERYTDRAAARRMVFVTVLAANLLMMIYFKYIGFLTGGRLTSPILPIGISFYLFQAAGYLIDVRRGTIPAEKNPIRYGLFVCFFPIVLSGPIERGGHLLPQFRTDFQETIRFDADRVRRGMVRMLWGFFCKLVLADRIAIAVNAVYLSPADYGGTVLFLTSLLYTMQLYLDFSGYSSIAVGTAQVLGIEVMENFRAPYLTESIGSFWRHWHISLSTWFRDYLYIPLGGSRRGRARKLLNLLIVFTLSGMWHGADLTFLIWGLLHGLYMVLGDLTKTARERMAAFCCGRDGRYCSVIRGLRIIRTFLLVNFAWIFFRSGTLTEALTVFRGFLHPAVWQLFDGTLLSLGVHTAEWWMIVLGCLLVFTSDRILLHEGCDLTVWISNRPLFIRWPVVMLGILVVLVCGVWGPGYDASSFIYYRF